MVTSTRPPRLGAYAEDRTYPDTGCHLHPSCLTCPIPENELPNVCPLWRDESEKWTNHNATLTAEAERRRVRAQAMREEGLDNKAIAECLGITPFSVWRLLKAAR